MIKSADAIMPEPPVIQSRSPTFLLSPFDFLLLVRHVIDLLGFDYSLQVVVQCCGSLGKLKGLLRLSHKIVIQSGFLISFAVSIPTAIGVGRLSLPQAPLGRAI